MAKGQRRGGKAGGAKGKGGKGRCSRIGRGQAVADALKRQAAERSPGQRQRRVVIKARIVRHRAGSGAAGAHLRYIQRDGTTRDGERGQLYGPDRDQEDGKAFVERGSAEELDWLAERVAALQLVVKAACEVHLAKLAASP
jgi:hypothetical protein